MKRFFLFTPVAPVFAACSTSTLEIPIPSNEIWYTSSDGNVIKPYSGSFNSNATSMQTFGANITSNTYENGKGVITFDGNVTMIGRSAFRDCSALTSVTIPDSVTTIGDDAFRDCDALKAFYGKFASADNRCLIVNGVLNSFAPAGLTTYSIPDSVTTIGDYAFYNCSALTDITIPDSVTTIGNCAFRGCYALKTFYGKFASKDNRCLIVDGILKSFAIGCGLTEYTIPDSVTTIGEDAFYYCYALTSVTIPNSVTTIGGSAFASCDALKAFYGKFASKDNRCLIVNGVLNSFAPAGLTTYSIPDSVTTIGKYAFAFCDALTSVTIPDSVTTIGERAFAFCYALTSVTIGNSVTTIGKGAFSGCDALTSVTIGNSVTTIGDGAFLDCDALTSVTIPDSVTTIGERAFNGCDALTSVTIPDSVTTIEDWAFRNCTSLKEVYCKPTTPPSLGYSSVFDDNASGRKIYVPTESVYAYITKQYWREYASAIEPYTFTE